MWPHLNSKDARRSIPVKAGLFSAEFAALSLVISSERAPTRPSWPNHLVGASSGAPSAHPQGFLLLSCGRFCAHLGHYRILLSKPCHRNEAATQPLLFSLPLPAACFIILPLLSHAQLEKDRPVFCTAFFCYCLFACFSAPLTSDWMFVIIVPNRY